mgnify:CR=1 FL=1
MNENFNIKDVIDLVVDMIFDELRQKIVTDREGIEEEE